jgi:methyl-accepting chemotaxis protein
MLRTWANHGEREKVLAAVPVVTAWRAAMAKAQEGGYEVRVPKFQPRNPKNEPDALEARVLHKFENESLTEYYEIDSTQNAVRYFRPIRLTEECMLCHGDPRNSAANWGNDKGLDATGVAMENWKVGEVHGAFEVVQSLAKADAARAAMLRTFVFAVLLCLGAGLGVTFWLARRSIIKPLSDDTQDLSDGAAQVVAAAQQVASSSQTLSQGATEQAAALEQTSASMEEMASMTKRNAENSGNAATLMKTVEACVHDSNRALASMVDSMAAMKASNQSVSRIIKTIDEIAFQTNILALNAAVEAARAGDAGMGFAVVADEVRNLALRSAQAARDTAGLIEDSIAKAQVGADQVEVVTASIGEITTNVTRVRGLIDEVSEASRQQTQGLDEVTHAIQQMERVTQSNAATAEETAAASEELNAQAETTKAVAARLDSLVSGASGAVSEVPSPRKSGVVLSMKARRQAESDDAEARTGTYS